MDKKLRTLAAISFLFFMGCGAEKKDENLIRIVLDWTPNTNHTGLYAALEKGWFEEEGLKVEIIQPPEDGALFLVGSGSAEFGIDFQETMGPAIAKGRDALPIQAVAAIISHNTSGIMSLAKSSIKRPADLSGKRYESWEMPLIDALIREIVETDGGDFNSVIMIPNYSTDALSALLTDVDALWGYYAWEVTNAIVKGFDINFINLAGCNPVFDFYTPVIFANTNWLSKNREKAEKFMLAASRGYSFAIENPVESAEILLKYVPELDRELVLRSMEYLAPRYQDDAPRWGEIDGERWGAFYSWMYGQGLLEKDIGQGGFTNEYLP